MKINDTPDNGSTNGNDEKPIKHVRPKKAPKSIIQKVKTIKRLVHYYELLIGYKSRYKPTVQYPFTDVMQAIISDLKSGVFTQHIFDDRTYLIATLDYDVNTNLYQGTLYTIRNEDFPVIFNNTTRIVRDIDANLDDGIAEISHFLVDCDSTYPKVALEYNAQGARINNLIKCLSDVGSKIDITEGIDRKTIVRDSLKDYVRRMGAYSRMTVKVHREDLPVVNNIAPGIVSGIDDAINRFGGEYGKMEIKFGYNKKGSPNDSSIEAKKDVFGAIKNLIKNPQNIGAFDTFVVEAEDVDNNNRLHAFDLLLDRVRSELIVEKREKSRTILTTNMFYLMKIEFQKLRLQ